MIREEAIEYLKRADTTEDAISRQNVIETIKELRVYVYNDFPEMINRAALINVVEKLPSVQPTACFSDLISRQAAIDAVEESRRSNYHQDGKEACAHEYEHRGFLKILHDLPSVQPEQKVGRWILGGYEDTKWICDKCEYQATEYYNPPKFKYCPNCGDRKEGE